MGGGGYLTALSKIKSQGDKMELVKSKAQASNIQVFNCELGSVRAILENGEPLFCLADLAYSLELTNPVNIKTSIDKEFDKGGMFNIYPLDTKGGKQNFTFINESELYFVIMRSKSNKAKPFRQWVCNEVLPSLRKNGGYIANQENMTPEQIVANALIVAQNIIADRDKTIAEQKQVIEYQGGKLENFTSVEKARRSKQELSTKLNKTIRLLAEQKFDKDYGKAYTYIYGEFAKLHCISDKVNMDYLKKNIDYLAECLAIATTELE